jgi:hypothetical protein
MEEAAIMNDRNRTFAIGFKISFVVWLLVVFVLIFNFLNGMSLERGKPLTYDELFEIALDFKYFGAVLLIGATGFFCLVRRPEHTENNN